MGRVPEKFNTVSFLNQLSPTLGVSIIDQLSFNVKELSFNDYPPLGARVVLFPIPKERKILGNINVQITGG